ncbi:MAG: hypothetical protein MUC99_08655 [Anaerolineae bacterium]|nr:hypothetical protein [Anaerolineae bacterium]
MLVIVFMVLALGLIAGQIITVWWVGVIGVAVTLLILYLIALLLWCVVFVGHQRGHVRPEQHRVFQRGGA